MRRNQRFMATRGALIICGFLVLCVSIGLAFYIFSVLAAGNQAARTLDRNGSLFANDPCDRAISWNAMLAQRVMSEGEDQVLTVSISNKDRTTTCDETVSIQTIKFQLKPDEPTYTLMVPPLSSRKLIWVVAPIELGTFTIAVSISKPQAFQTLGVKVTDIFGLTIGQAKLVSYIGGALGTLFGPMLTVPWWYERWKERKKKHVTQGN